MDSLKNWNRPGRLSRPGKWEFATKGKCIRRKPRTHLRSLSSPRPEAAPWPRIRSLRSPRHKAALRRRSPAVRRPGPFRKTLRPRPAFVPGTMPANSRPGLHRNRRSWNPLSPRCCRHSQTQRPIKLVQGMRPERAGPSPLSSRLHERNQFAPIPVLLIGSGPSPAQAYCFRL